MEDERITALLESNNDLSLALTQSNENVQQLKTENVSLKACGLKDSTVKWLIQKVNKQKSQYDTNFRGKEYALVLADSETKFIESSNISCEDIRTQEDVEKLLKHMAKAGYILSKLYTARDSYNKGTKFEAEELSLQELENEIMTFTETKVTVTDDICLVYNESETGGTISANKFLHEEPSVQCNDSSTQTDLLPTISHALFKKLNNIRLEFPCPKIRLSKLEENYESSKMKNAIKENQTFVGKSQN